MGSLRRAVEVILDERHHTTFIVWAMRRMSEGASLRTMSTDLTQMVGFPVSHETIRQWVVDG